MVKFLPVGCQNQTSDAGVYAVTMAGKARSLTPAESDRLTDYLRPLIEEYGSASALSKAMIAAGHDISQPTISAQLRGSDPGGFHLARQVAAFRRVSVEEILSGRPSGATPRWRDLPGWAAAVAAAVVMFPRVSALAFERLGNLMGEQPPNVSALTIGLLASTWDNCSTDEARVEAIATNARREMADEDAAATVAIKRRHEARERGEPLPPLPGEPVKPRPRKPPPKPSRG